MFVAAVWALAIVWNLTVAGAARADRGAWSLVVEDCPESRETLGRVRRLLTENDASDVLTTTACGDPLAQLSRARSSAIGGATRVTLAATRTVDAGPGVRRIDLDDFLLLYQKDGPNWASRSVRDVLGLWRWNRVSYYVDAYYDDGSWSLETGKEPSTVERFYAVERVPPRDLVRRLTADDGGGHGVSVVVVANATVARRLLRAASRARLLSGRHRWFVLTDGGRARGWWPRLDPGGRVYAVRHAGVVQDVGALLLEYVEARLSSANASVPSIPSLDDGTTYGEPWSEEDPSPAHTLEVAVRLEMVRWYSDADGETRGRTVGRWTPLAGWNLSPDESLLSTDGDPQRRLRVAVSEAPPYVVVDRDPKTGRVAYSGYLVDVLGVVVSVLGLGVEYVPVSETSANASWTGIVAALANGEAEVGLAALAATPDRLQAIDFARVAVDVQATAGLYRRPGSDGEGMDKFGVYLEPFDLPVWIASIVAVVALVVALRTALWLTERLAGPSGVVWENDRLEGSRAVLLGFQAIAQQGCELNFANPSSRIVFLVLWLFALIAYSSYSATLMSYLTVNRVYAPFDGLSSLARNKDYRIGFLDSSSDLEMFRDSASRHYRAVWKRVAEQHYSTVVDGFGTGFARVRDEKFVLLAPDKTMQYLTRNTCDLVVSKPLTSVYPVTLAFRKGSPRRADVDRVLRSMSDAGLLYRLRDKWWGTALFCQQEAQMFASLSLTNVATGFLLLLGGIVGGTLGLLAEGTARRCSGRPPDLRPSVWRPPVPRPHRPRKFFHF